VWFILFLVLLFSTGTAWKNKYWKEVTKKQEAVSGPKKL
jgi:hypothetical protein